MDRRTFIAACGVNAVGIGAIGSQAAAALPARPTADSPAAAAQWLQWRGARRDGSVQGVWSQSISELKQRWTKPLSPSYSGPLATDTHIYVTETVDKKNEVATALDRRTGEVTWQASWPGSMSVPFFARANGDWIRATPAIHEGLIYVAGMRDMLVALDAASGQESWKVDFMERYQSPLPSFGYVSSPLPVGEHLYVQAGGGFVKLEAATGKSVWRSLADGGGMGGSAFSSPVIATLDGVEQLIVQSRTRLVGVDPETGGELWSVAIPAFRGMNILTPTIKDNRIFTSSYGGKSILLEVTRQGGEWSVKELWKCKLQGYMSSPVLVDGHIYLHLRNQRFACIDWKTGEEKWITTPYGKYWSMVTNGQRMLALDERGTLLEIAANPREFELIESRKVSDAPAWAHLAVAGNDVIVRDLRGVTVWNWAANA